MSGSGPRLLMIALLAVMMPGCLVEKHTLVIHKDGSADLTIHYGMTKPVVRQLRNAENIIRELPDSGNDQPTEFINPYRFDQDHILNELEAYKESGIQVRNVTTEEKSGWHYATIDLSLRSIADLAALSDTALLANHRYSLKAHKEDYLITHRFTHNEQAGDVDLTDPEIRENLLPLLQGLRVTIDIQAPAYIKESNAHIRGVRGGIWDYDFDRNEKSANRIQKDKRQLLISGEDMRLPEFGMRQPAAPAQAQPATPSN